MRKIGIAALTLLALATAACAESPVGIHAEGTRAVLGGGAAASAAYEEPEEEGAYAQDPDFVAIGADAEPALSTRENPGLGLSGN
jgi:hypothetical protein